MDNLEQNNILDLENHLDKELEKICTYLSQPDSVKKSQPTPETEISYYILEYMRIGGTTLGCKYVQKALTRLIESNESRKAKI